MLRLNFNDDFVKIWFNNQIGDIYINGFFKDISNNIKDEGF